MLYQVAAVLTLCIVGYDLFLKRIPIVGPLIMGLCRFFNILFVYVYVGEVFYWSQFPLDGGLSYAGFVGLYVTIVTVCSRYEAGRPRIQRLVGWGLALLIPLDATICLLIVQDVIACALVLSLFFLAMGLRRIVAMT